MKKSRTMMIVFGCICFFFVAVSIGRAADAESTAISLSNELQGFGVTTQDEAIALQPTLMDMIKEGASKEELLNVMRELSKNGLAGDELRASVNSMNDLLRKGEDLTEAASVVSPAAAQANQQGLEGKKFAAKIQEVVKQHKVEKVTRKKIEKGQWKAQKVSTNDVKKAEKAQEKAEKARARDAKRFEKERIKDQKMAAKEAKKAESKRIKDQKLAANEAKKAEKAQKKDQKFAAREAQKAEKAQKKDQKLAAKEAKKAEREKIKAQKVAAKEAKKAEKKKQNGNN